MTRKPRSHVRILIYRTWAIGRGYSLSYSTTVFVDSSVFLSHHPYMILDPVQRE